MATDIGPILLVDDSPNDIELTLAALADNNLDGNVVVVRDGEEALDYMYRRGAFSLRAEGNPKVVFLDLKLPKVDGMEVLRDLKSDAELQKVPIVMLTASQEEPDLLRSYKLGVNAYVTKPAEFQQFVHEIKALGIFWGQVNHPPPGSFAPNTPRSSPPEC